MYSALGLINQLLNHLFAMICLRQPVKLTAAGLANCGRTISTLLPPIGKFLPNKSSPVPEAMIADLTKLGGDTAQYALDHKLVDALGSSADVEKH